MNQQKLKEKFSEDILEILCGWDSDERRKNWKTGSSISYIKVLLEEKGWKNLGRLSDFEYDIEKAGFKIIPAITKKGFHKSVRVISL